MLFRRDPLVSLFPEYIDNYWIPIRYLISYFCFIVSPFLLLLVGGFYQHIQFTSPCCVSTTTANCVLQAEKASTCSTRWLFKHQFLSLGGLRPDWRRSRNRLFRWPRLLCTDLWRLSCAPRAYRFHTTPGFADQIGTTNHLPKKAPLLPMMKLKAMWARLKPQTRRKPRSLLLLRKRPNSSSYRHHPRMSLSILK